jgi:phthalate 4,5-dioxygenase reductase subunit
MSADGDAFEVELASSGRVIAVARGQSVLEALRAAGIERDSSCEAGTCGTCRTRVLAGEVDHQDFVLDDREQAQFMMICVSRARSARLRLDL